MLAVPCLLYMGDFGSRNYVWFGFLKGLLPEENVFLSKLICSPSFSPQFEIMIKRTGTGKLVWHSQSDVIFPWTFWNQVWKYSKREIIFMHKWGRSANLSWWPQHTSPGMWWYLGWDQSILDTVSSDWVLIPLSQPALPWWSPSLCSFSVILQVFSARYCRGSGMAEQCSQSGKVESALTSTVTPQSCRRQKEDLTLYVSPLSSHTS